MADGVGFSVTASDNSVKLTTTDPPLPTNALTLSSSDIFLSSIPNGKLSITTASLEDLYTGTEMKDFNQYETISFTASVNTITKNLACGTSSQCLVRYSRSMTPIVHYLTSPVVYKGLKIGISVDPKSAQNWARSGQDPPFISASFDGTLMDFEDAYNETTRLSANTLNQVIGLVGDQEPNVPSDFSMRFIAGNAYLQPYSMKICDYNNQNCYYAKTVPKIESISASEGYISGGQTLTITGYGFRSTSSSSVVIDGVACEIVSQTLTEIQCITGSKSTPSLTGQPQVGQKGLRRKQYSNSNGNGVSITNLASADTMTESLLLNFDTLQNQADNYGQKVSGYFKAPATEKYRFFISGDDTHQLYLSTVPNDPSQKQQIAGYSGYSSYRDYYKSPGQISNWIDLEKDKYYYIEARHVEGGGGDHLTVSVQIKQSAVFNHQHGTKEIQKLSIVPVNIPEQTIYTIRGPFDSGGFKLKFHSQRTGNPWPDKDFVYIQANNPTASQFKSAVQQFYSQEVSSNIDVKKEMFDINDVATTNITLTEYIKYTVTLLRQIPGQTLISIPTITPNATTATLEVTLPGQPGAQLSSAPLSGSFSIVGYVSDGSGTTTQCVTSDIGYNWSPSQIQARIIAACPKYRDIYVTQETDDFPYYENGREILIQFLSLSDDIPQFQIQSGNTVTLSGSMISFVNETPRQYSPDVFYEPIPFDMLYTDELKPQVMVTIDGLPAVCASLQCDYAYISTNANIQSFTLSGTSLTITGQNIAFSDIQSITYASVPCIVQSGSATGITCTLDGTPVAGSSWVPKVITSNGEIPVSATSQGVPLTITNISGIGNGLNPNGGDVITIEGTGFPSSLESGDSVVVTIGGSTVTAEIQSVTPTSVTILTTSGFSLSSIGTAQQISVEVNGVQGSTTFSSNLNSSPATITGLNVTTVSPVLKSAIELQVDPAYTNPLVRDNFKVYLTENGVDLKELRVLEVDDTNNKIIVKFGGAPSGTYGLRVVEITDGDFNTRGISFTTGGVVASISPSQGSIYGGTLVTIQGNTFSNDPLDNNVKIGTTDCIVISSSANEIKCITYPRQAQFQDPTTIIEDLVVFLKASEEAQCLGNCQFTWISDPTLLPSISSRTETFNTNTGYYEMTINGSGFPTSSSLVKLYIDNLQQEIISSSDTQIVAKITGMLTTNSKQVDLVLPSGVSPDYATLQSGINLQPKLLSITPNQGSPSGHIITAIVRGLGTETLNVQLLDNSGQSICQKLTIISFETIECQTVAKVISSPQDIKVKIGTAAAVGCANSDITKCQYSTISNGAKITSITSSGNQMTLSGENFPTTGGYNGIVTYGGVEASSVVILSNSQIQATFNLGIPNFVQTTPVVEFQSSVDSYFGNVTQNFTNQLTITGQSIPSECSFAGGCSISFTGNGLSSTLEMSDKAYIDICGQKCEFSQSDSTSSIATCKLPALGTTYSAENYHITQSGNLEGTIISSMGTNHSLDAAKVFDGFNFNGWANSNTNCYFGMKFKPGFVGVLTSVKLFMNRFTKTNFIGKLAFQGSNDAFVSNIQTIFTVDATLHEGWNYYDFNDNLPKYNAYRFYSQAGSCQVGEAALIGVEVIDDINSTPNQPQIGKPVSLLTFGAHECQPKVIINDQLAYTSPTNVTYSSSVTAKLTSINPRFGNVKGGENIVFSGENFDTDLSKYTIKIDGISCTPLSVSTTQLTCKTGPRPGIHETSTLQIFISGKGYVATQGLVFRYCNLWSDEDSWSGEFAPLEGESVHVPKGVCILVDVDSTPILNAILVEGSMIFPPNQAPTHQRTFDANYVFVNGGLLEVGTEQFPYTSKLTITLYGNKESPEIPIYGNKVIGVRDGTLELHGVKRSPTWTELQKTANPNANQITLKELVDWQVGESIVIAPTGYDNKEAEERIITGVSIDNTDPNKPVTVITIDQPLLYKHYAGIQTFGVSDTIEMRAEVGLLSRNVIFRGDPETSSTFKYGAHIMLHSKGDDSLAGKIEYCEFRDVGQAFQLGRYPIHFHVIGNVHNSYIRGNSIHHTYNRAVTIHGVHYLRVLWNVAYKTMGHTFFIEDAIETKNRIEYNLAIQTERSWSLLNTDQTPASFWITNPDNIFIGNHAAGSDRYGFWFDLQRRPIGAFAFVQDVCPEYLPLGDFQGNVAHSNGRYGLRIFHVMSPLTSSCDKYNELTNPTIPAIFQDFVSYKNGRNGAIAEQVGDVKFINFKTADNILAGIEFSLTDITTDGKAQIIDALIIGHSANADAETLDASPHGIITPRTEDFQVNGAKFYNFNKNDMAALGSCSHCFHPAATDSGARTVKFSALYFDTSVTRKIRYQFPFRAIYQDTDNTLTGLGQNSWATPDWTHNRQPECVFDSTTLSLYNGIICKPEIEVRRIVFFDYSPSTFNGMEMKILKWDQSYISTLDATALKAYKDNKDNYSIVPFKPKTNPGNAWAMPYVTNHMYKVHWRNGLDFDQMRIQLSSRWQATDHNLYLAFNFTDVRAKVDFIVTSANPDYTAPNGTYLTNSDLQTGDNVVYNETADRIMYTVINGKNSTKTDLVMKGTRCIGSCQTTVKKETVESTVRLWSAGSSWTNGTTPKVGEDVVVQSGWNMRYDLTDSPIYNMIQINGRLTFDTTKNLTLRVKHLFVNAGELIIGSEDQPFPNNVKIILIGEQENQHMLLSNAVEAGNKIIANAGDIRMYGKYRSYNTRLAQSAQVGETNIKVGIGLDWVPGDYIVLAPTASDNLASDYVQVKTYNQVTGDLELMTPLKNYHFGQATSTGTQFNGVDMRCEVYLLTRNIQIIGEDVNGWGGQIVTTEYQNSDDLWVVGHTIMDNVEIYNCSQRDTYKAAIRFENNELSWSQISNSSIHHGLGRGLEIRYSKNIRIFNNVFHDFSTIGGNIQSSDNITLDTNAMIRVTEREINALDKYVDPRAGFAICGINYGDKCEDLTIVNNIVAGAVYTGFASPVNSCGVYGNTFRNNIAHSVQGYGHILFPDFTKSDSGTCFEGSHFIAYKNTEAGVVTFFASLEVRLSYATLIDNAIGVSALLANPSNPEAEELKIKLNSLVIYGDSGPKDCSVQNQCTNSTFSSKYCKVGKRIGMMLSYVALGGKVPFPSSGSGLPFYKIKADAAWGGVVEATNLEFHNFESATTWCGTKQTVFAMNPTGADYHPIQKFHATKFVNVHSDAFAYLMDPPQAWANIDDCGQFPCTGPMNLAMIFTSTLYEGTVIPTANQKDFQVMANNTNVAKAFGCEYQSLWNAYYCFENGQDNDMAILLFESQDVDKRDRTVSPIIITSDSLGIQKYSNVLNSFMDHVWDGFYTGQIRLTRFPAIVKANQYIEKYTIEYTGTPPEKQRFKLVADNTQKKVIVKINYTKTGTYAIINHITNQTIKANGWDEVNKQPKQISGTICGENRFIGVENILEFYLEGGCSIRIVPQSSILTKLRLQWTVAEFFADGGTTKFIDRFAASLGIHASTVKVVSVYEGSLIVELAIVNPNENDPNVLRAIETTLKQKIENDTLWVGAPILDAAVSENVVSTIKDSSQSNNQSSNGTTGNQKIPSGIEKNPSEETESVAQVGLDTKKVIIICCAILGAIIIFFAIVFLLYKKLSMTKAKPAPEEDVDVIDENEYEYQYHPKAE